ncbi:Maf family nucleotide pyrophosphatase [Janibacter terrae]|jgi:septum formation protein|uniref:Nucleoside triphosphate pyrophosphatase n=1 Tax=Janibacter terrae TaxID=103817 RepID=A0ABZ2FAK4_9MICO|nr:nucleoside triphosphate pyrophosphatase [Janibacter terrae]MBA4083483.1 septum formation inhibitor Maf [Kytococcus sp.]HCE60265.1 septum formation inhibitor Maf [Janibacter terrae]
MTSVVLASASPARLALLRAAGIDPQVVVSHVDEPTLEAAARQRDPHLSPAALAQLLAEAKGASVADRLPPGTDLVIACDSVLEMDGRVHGKPGTAEVARERWRTMRGRSGELHTGHHVIDLRTGRTAGAPASARVHFTGASDAEVDGYVATGEPLHVAGGFTIDGLGAPFVERIEGHPSTVIGLCLPLLRRLLTDLDVAWWTVSAAPQA